MNSIQTLRKKHIIIFLMSVFLSLLMLSLSFFFSERLFSETSNAGVNGKAQAACLSFLRDQGFQPHLKSGGIKVHDASSRNIEEVLYRAGVAIAYCPSHKLIEFCAGNACENPGVFFLLQPDKL